MTSNHAVEAVALSKVYRLYRKPWDSLKEWLLRRPYHQQITALEEIGFTLAPGETLGIVGNNGAGKSTLLKILAKTIAPSSGRCEIHGRVSAILELGSGFHPDFTGRENARMGCALLGLNAQETQAVLPEIEAFSELGAFFDRPVKTYSSGMYVRLAFSVVTAIDPDVLIVDEALSVGDQHFQKKSLNRMRQFRESGKTIVFCTHNTYQIKELCAKALWLEHGRCVQFGDAYEVVDHYQDALREQDAKEPGRPPRRPVQPGETHLIEITLNRPKNGASHVTGDSLEISVSAHIAPEDRDDVHVGVVIMRNDHIHCYGVSTQIDDIALDIRHDGRCRAVLQLAPLQLLSGQYYLCVYLLGGDGIHIYDYREEICPFAVRHHTKEVGVARLAHRWS